MIKFSSDQTFIVTGASSGIGACVSLLLNKLGASVVAIARNRERLNALKVKSENPETFFVESLDLTEQPDLLPQYVTELKNKYGKFAGMAYCAGISPILPIRSVSMENLLQVFTINYFSAIMMVKGVVDKRNNVGNGTSIVAISSIASKFADKGQALYSGSKAALDISLNAIAKEVASLHIRINTILPSLVNTEMQANAVGNYLDLVKNCYPFGFAEPYDVAHFIIFLLSDKSKWITGQNYIIDCGSH